ncbi:hypothetical protein FNH22_05100 [Fulvivirga sp. M361]|uniref:hypothetical protein n=1 Tax=Fulvivirga sp. M361 TaxID=2594266 RepID=UPI00117B76F2|nr:hypothetical protein [Fulvivirga sp. M361]TRX61434.1 hypothetical protein FNH22_05100 [Fulvivirga sp. M361]
MLEKDKLYLFDNKEEAEAFAYRPFISDEVQPTPGITSRQMATQYRLPDGPSYVDFYSHVTGGPRYFFIDYYWMEAEVSYHGHWNKKSLRRLRSNSNTKLYTRGRWPYDPDKWYDFPKDYTMDLDNAISEVYVNNSETNAHIVLVLYDGQNYEGRQLLIRLGSGDAHSYKLKHVFGLNYDNKTSSIKISST